MNIKWYNQPIEQIFAYFHTDRNGLSQDQIEYNKKKYGTNYVETEKLEPFIKLFLEQFSDFIIWMLIIAAVISILLGHIIDSTAILIIVIINAFIGAYQEKKAQTSLASLKRMSSQMAKVIRNSEIMVVPSEELVAGDIVIIEAGDHIPADMRLFEAHNLSIDESLLTGENIPVEKIIYELNETDLLPADQLNMAFKGSTVIKGKGKGVVVEVGKNTQIGAIAEAIKQIKPEKTPLQKKMEELGRYIVYFCISISFLVVSIGLFTGYSFLDIFMLGVSLSVAAIPEGLPAIITITLAIGVSRMVKRHAIIRKLPAVEVLGNVNIICSDKTGTLTQNKMVVKKIFTVDDKEFNVTGEGYSPEGKIIFNDNKINIENADNTLINLIKCGVICNDSELSPPGGKNQFWHVIGNPTEGALLTLGKKFGINRSDIIKPNNIIYQKPFDNETKFMAIITKENDKFVLYIKGAPDIIIEKVKFYKNKETSLDETAKEKLIKKLENYAKEGLRSLGFAYMTFDSEQQIDSNNLLENTIFLGFVGIQDPPRPEVRRALIEAKEAGIETIMITGDHRLTAFTIAKELGIAENEEQVLTGKELEQLSDEELFKIIDKIKVYARTSPHHKLRIVKILKQKNYIVGMTGDGVNDAPALKEANIGIAMGLSGVDVARDASDMILTDDNYATIIAAVEEGRNIVVNIKKAIFFILSHNAANILIVLFSILANFKNIITPLQLLWINLITDSLPALSFSAENKEPDLMRKKETQSKNILFSNADYLRIVWQGSLLTLSSLGGFYYILTITGNYLLSKTVLFAIMVYGQQIQALNCRSNRFSIFKIGLFSNKFLIGAISISIILQTIIHILPITQNIFLISSLSNSAIITIIVMSLFPLLIVELYKLIKNRG